MKIDSLEKLYVHELKDLYSAENQLLEALPMMIAAANDKKLKKAFSDHLAETRTHAVRLRSLFEELAFEPGGHKCSGIAGLLKEVEE